MNEAQSLLKCMGLMMPIENYLQIAFEQFQEDQDNRFGIEVVLKESYSMNDTFINGMFKHWGKQI